MSFDFFRDNPGGYADDAVSASGTFAFRFPNNCGINPVVVRIN